MFLGNRVVRTRAVLGSRKTPQQRKEVKKIEKNLCLLRRAAIIAGWSIPRPGTSFTNWLNPALAANADVLARPAPPRPPGKPGAGGSIGAGSWLAEYGGPPRARAERSRQRTLHALSRPRGPAMCKERFCPLEPHLPQLIVVTL